jgi:serine/threonine protein kinase
MDMMDGSLSDLPPINTIYEVFVLFYKIIEILQCLNNLGLAYTDIKKGNILFKCYENYKIKIALGDLGSICNKGKKEAYTYTPPEYFNGGNNCTESSVVWGAGVLLLTLLNIKDSLFYHRNVKNLKDKKTYELYIKAYINTINKNYNFQDIILNDNNNITFADLLVFIFETDPKIRANLDTILNLINIYIN